MKDALARYTSVCDSFDSTKFSSSEPLTFESVPWPTLISPMKLTIGDVQDWAAVEKFFETIRAHLKKHDYETLLEKSLRRFHPDRWSARGLLKTVENGTERDNIEMAANTVSQALTPLWRDIKGR